MIRFWRTNIIKKENNEFKKVHFKKRNCYYFNDIIKSEDFDFDKSHKNILSYGISFKTLIGPKPLCTRFDKIEDLLEFMMELDI